MLKRTPLYEEHRKLGAKLVDFGGWEMPIQYKSIIAEYQAVRSGVGVFDVSHMGEVEISGEGALELVQHLVSNDVAALKVNQVLYSPLCYPNGMTVDDLLVYRRPEQYLLVVNADNTPKDLAWIKGQAERFPRAQVRDASLDYGQLAIQGPEAPQALQPFIEYDLARISYYWAVEIELQGQAALVSRTGYTGEELRAVLAAERPDLIIVDIMMPDLDGIEVCLHLRQWSDVPIIMRRAWGAGGDMGSTRDMRADCYLTEPFGIDELRTRINEALQRNLAAADTLSDIPSSAS